jgi:uracil-DNA glycosylase
MTLPLYFEQALLLAHPSWQGILRDALLQMQVRSPGYLAELTGADFLPDRQRIFAAFSVPLDQIRYVLVGEGPYPRAISANGYCFMDAAVDSLWSNEVNGGLSKSVNRATSLRNFMKMLLVAESMLTVEELSPEAIATISMRARSPQSGMIQSMADLHQNFLSNGFLMLNASLVFRAQVAPAIDAKAWEIFLARVFAALAALSHRPVVILWGKIAERLLSIPSMSTFEIARSEHPYNLSFIANETMQTLFAELKLLRKARITTN